MLTLKYAFIPLPKPSAPAPRLARERFFQRVLFSLEMIGQLSPLLQKKVHFFEDFPSVTTSVGTLYRARPCARAWPSVDARDDTEVTGADDRTHAHGARCANSGRTRRRRVHLKVDFDSIAAAQRFALI